MSKLILEFSPVIKHDRAIVPAVTEWLSRIFLKVEECSGDVVVVFDVKWDAKIFVEWLASNERGILSEVFHLPESTSLARSVFEALERDLTNAEEDYLYGYRTRHDLRFALRGVDIPCSGLMKLDTHLGESARQIEVPDDRASLGALIQMASYASGVAQQLPINTRNNLPKNLIFPTRFRHGRILCAPNARATVRLSLQIQRYGFRSPVVNRRTAPRKRFFCVRVMASCVQEASACRVPVYLVCEPALSSPPLRRSEDG
ncbi:hypothetical protein HX866_30455 [Pseudomonas gingeri]|uniref:hypothetical protein n=1 Tax=Pseudomonas gingeri TaxID=117681 RepID=UPI0015A0CF55|nr:hypothetical protein [Pseudomonas gingeri]NWA29215.1 hypothetical protein [Pseudomonas gingeri]